jgi:hypothetical protein
VVRATGGRAGVGKTFIYYKRRPELTAAVLAGRDASQNRTTERAEQRLHNETTSWRERAINAEALAKTLRATVQERDARISDLTGQLYDPDGSHLEERNAELRQMVATINHKLRQAEIENGKLRRSLEAARANVRHERERNVALIGSQEYWKPGS